MVKLQMAVRRKKDPKLIRLLKALDNKEMRELHRFVRSPYFNANKRVMALFEEVRKHHPKYPAEKMDRRQLHRAAYGEAAFNDMDIQREMSRLAKLVERFIVWKEISSDTPAMHTAELAAFRKRGLSDHFAKAAKAGKDFHDTHPVDMNSLYHRFRVEEEVENFNREANIGHQRKADLENLASRFDGFFVAQKLKLYCVSFAYQEVHGESLDDHFIPEILGQLDRMDPMDPSVELYRYAVLCSLHPDEPTYFEKLNGLMHTDSGLSTAELVTPYDMAQNHCMRQLNRGIPGYVNKLFDLYRFGLDRSLLLADGVVHPIIFTNIVTIGSKAGQHPWVERFIRDKADLMSEDYRTPYTKYNLAYLYFQQGCYSEARSYIQNIQDGSYYITIRIRLLLVQIYYELSQMDLAERELKGLSGYLKRHRDESYHELDTDDLLQVLQSLIRLNRNDLMAVDELLQRVNGMDRLQRREWIIAKLEEMKG